MESPFLHPSFLLSAIVGIITLVAWFIRLESKINTNGQIIAHLERELAKTENHVENHVSNQDIHFNLRVNTQVEKGNERRFQTIENQLSEINRKLDKMAGKE